MAAASPANADTPHGATATGIIYGLNAYAVDSSNSTAFFRGDLVAMETDGNVIPSAASSTHVVGAVESVTSISTAAKTLLAASTAGTVLCHYHRSQQYYMQIDDGTPAVTHYGANADISVTNHTGNTNTGISGQELDDATVNTTAGLLMRIHGLLNRSDNLIGDHAELVCTINGHFETAGTAGI